MLRVAVIGAGYWGPNLIRNFHTCPLTRLVAVCDRDTARLAKAVAPYPAAVGVRDFGELLARDDIDAVAIATPVWTHAPLALAALRAGKHVVVEKPLAASSAQAHEMVDVARRRGLTLMIDHTYIYSPAVRKIKELIDGGTLGEIFFVDGVRINLGLFQQDVNVVWDLAPHDLSVLDYLLGRPPLRVSAVGACHARHEPAIEDVAHLSLDFGGGLLASFHVNWLSPVKIRQFIIGGSKKSLVFNELEPTEKIKVYDRGIQCREDLESRKDILISYRIGDVCSPHVEQGEPLQNMVSHFATSIGDGTPPLSDGESGLRVVHVLEAAERSIKAHGAPIDLRAAIRRAA